MKKFFALVLCLSAIFCSAIPAMAKTNELVLTYSNEASYEIEIPTSLTINKDGTGDFQISVNNVKLGAMDAVYVSADGSYDPMYETWYLTNVANENDKIQYNMYLNENKLVGGIAAIVTQTDVTETVTVQLSDTSKIGTFTDTITFTSYIEAYSGD